MDDPSLAIVLIGAPSQTEPLAEEVPIVSVTFIEVVELVVEDFTAAFRIVDINLRYEVALESQGPEDAVVTQIQTFQQISDILTSHVCVRVGMGQPYSKYATFRMRLVSI